MRRGVEMAQVWTVICSDSTTRRMAPSSDFSVQVVVDEFFGLALANVYESIPLQHSVATIEFG